MSTKNKNIDRKKHKDAEGKKENQPTMMRLIWDAIPLEKLKPLYIFGIATLIFFADQLTKYIAAKSLAVNESYKFLPFLYFTYLQNTGTFFGLAKHSTGFLILFSVIVIALILWKYKEIPADKFLYVLFGLILGGAFGNLLDRLFLGYVRDFIDILIWPVFNVADMAISAAIVGLIWYVIRKD